MIKEAMFTSVWDGGYMVTSPCKVNLDTGEIIGIEMVDVSDMDLCVLDKEYVTIDGVNYPASNDEDTEFWYQ